MDIAMVVTVDVPVEMAMDIAMIVPVEVPVRNGYGCCYSSGSGSSYFNG
jgi:hypothetical protein